MTSSSSTTSLENHQAELDIVREIMAFWQDLTNSDLQKLAQRMAIEQAARLWEQQAQVFYHRWATSSPAVPFHIIWNETYWRYYRSILLIDRTGAAFLFPKECFDLQGLSSRFYGQLWKCWQAEAEKSLTSFLSTISALRQDLIIELSPDELICLKSAPKSAEDPDLQAVGWLVPQFFSKMTHFAPNRLRKALHRLRHYGILGMRAYVNFARSGLVPYLLISPWPLFDWAEDYCFFQVHSPQKGLIFSGLAIPPRALDLTRHYCKADRFESITSFSAGWNLSQLGENGWGEYPRLLKGRTDHLSWGQVTLDFQIEAMPLQPLDSLYLERAQTCSTRMMRGEFGPAGQQRIRALTKAGVLVWNPTFQAIQCRTTVFLYGQASSETLHHLQQRATAFPRSWILRGDEWILVTLTLPPAWVVPALTELQTFVSELGIQELVLDVQKGAIERFIPFSKLWPSKIGDWVV